MNDPLTDTSQWTLCGDLYRQRLQSVGGLLRDVLADADLTITYCFGLDHPGERCRSLAIELVDGGTNKRSPQGGAPL